MEIIPQVGDYVFFTTSDGLTCSGSILSVLSDHVSVQYHDPSPQLKTFLPSWIRGDRTKSQRKPPKGYKPDLCEVPIRSIELTTTLTHSGHLPESALALIRAKGIAMPFEFDPNAADDTVSSNTVSAFRKSPQRISRRSSFAVSPKQRDWIMVQLRALRANVTHDAFQDHALLLQIIIRGTRSPPASSVIDSNERAIRAMVQGDRADFECRTNQLYRIRFLMLAYPHKQWIRTPPSPQTQGKPHCKPSTCAPQSSFVRRTSPKPTPQKTNYPKAAYRPPSPTTIPRKAAHPARPQVYTGTPVLRSSTVQQTLPARGHSSRPAQQGLHLPRVRINQYTITHLFALVGLLYVLTTVYHCLC